MSDAPSSSETSATMPAVTLVWEWPLRLWHWLFALCIVGSLGTGLSGDVGLLEWHLRFGYWVLGLLLFRLLWAIWGGRYARFSSYATSPRRIVAYFRGDWAGSAHTPPGAALVLLLLLLATLQAVAGLFSSDEIFTEGPLARHAPAFVVTFMTAAHHRIFWCIIAAIAVHLAGHLVYGLRRDPAPLSMFTGRKAVAVPPTDQRWAAAIVTATVVLLAVWLGLAAL